MMPGLRWLRTYPTAPGHHLRDLLIAIPNCFYCELADPRNLRESEGHPLCTCGSIGTHVKSSRGSKQWHHLHENDIERGVVSSLAQKER